MNRGPTTPMDEAQVSGNSFVCVSVNDQPPVPAIPQKNRELKRAVSPLDFSFLPSTELDRSRTSPGTRNLGFTTDRSGKIVQSGTLRRAAANMNSLARNKSSDQLVLEASTSSSQSPTILSGTLNKNVMSNGQDGPLTVTDNGANRKAATLDRSWRIQEADLKENLPQVGGTFSFDLERDAQVLLDLISTFEENVVDSRRLNSTPSSPGFFEGGQMTVIRRKTQQKSSSGESLSLQRVACDVPGFDEKPVMHKKDAFGSPGFNKTPTGNQTPHPEFDEASVKSQKVNAGLQKSNKTFHKVATGASNVHTTPNRSQELPYGNTEIDQTSGFYKKFSVADDDPPGYPVYSPSSKDILNGALLSPEAGNNGVLYNHRAGQMLRLPSTPGGHMGVSAQRGYASDSEDPMDWLQQQRAKLKLKLFRQGGTKLDPRLLQELKIRQKILGRTPVDEKETLVYSVSSDGAQTSKLPAQSPELYYGEYGRRVPTPDSSTAWSDSDALRQNYDPGVRGSDGRAGTPDFDQNHGAHFAKETQSPGHGCRSPLTLPTYANGVPLTNCQSFSENPTRATDPISESAKGTNNVGPSYQREVHETCISKKIIHQHRGYSPTRLDALIDAAAVTPDCESSPSSSQSTEISDSGYRTASASSTNDESPLTNTGQKISSNSVQEVPMNKNGQTGVDHFNMAQPNSRHHVTSVDSSSKINERFNAQSRPPATVAYQFEIPGSVHTQTWSPAAHPQQYFTTSPQRPTFAQTVVTSVVSHNAPNPNRSKTLEEEIEDLMALGEQLKVERRPIESQLPLQDQRRPFVGIQEPFVYTSAVKSSSDVSYQHPIHLTEAQRQMMRLTGNQIPASSIDNPVLNSRQPMNGNLPIYQTVRTTTGVDLPTETRMFNQLHVETYQPNRMLAEPSYQRKETQTTNGGLFNPNLGKPSGLRDQELFVLQPTPLNYHTLPNNAARHETVNISRYTEQQRPPNQQFAGDCNRIGPWNAEQDTVKYATTVQADRTQPSGKSANSNTFPNHIGSSGQEFQGRKVIGSESAIGSNGFEYQRSVVSGNQPQWTGDGNHKCVILNSNDGRQVLVPQGYLDSTTAPPQSIPSRGAIPEHRVENSVSGRVVNNVAQDSRITQQQMGQRVVGAGSEGQMIDRYGLTAPDSYNTVRRQVSAGPVQQQQQPFGATRVENIRSGSLQAQVQSPNDAVQRAPFYSQNSDSVFGSPPPAAVSMNQVVAHLRGEVSRTSSFSSSVTGQSSPSLSVDRSSGGSASSNRVVDGVDVSPHYVMQCVRDAYKEWYKPEISRDDVVNFLKDKPPGSFIIRNSTSYAGDFALAVKVAEIPVQIQQKTGDMSEEFVRHFLIESKPSGIRLKGRSNEPVFASLTSFVFQHALTPLSLPHRLLLPTSTETSSAGSGTGSLSRSSSSTNPSKAHDEISSMLIYIGAVDLETLTGPEGLEKAVSHIEAQKTSPVTTTVVNFILSSQGIVLTDTKRKLFFRRHYPLSCISYCGIDRGERRWTEDVDGSKKNTDRRIFGFVSRKRGSSTMGSQSSPDGNECHLFADYETGYPADSVVDLINKTLGENGYSLIK